MSQPTEMEDMLAVKREEGRVALKKEIQLMVTLIFVESAKEVASCCAATDATLRFT